MICPRCGRSYDPATRFCSSDGTLLVQSDLERLEDEPTLIGTVASFGLDPDGPPDRSDIQVVVNYRGPDPGDKVGDYEIQEQIGAGGMANVFRAVHTFSGKPVAIKLLNPRVSAETEAVGRFIQEARAVQLIGHRNIIDIISFERLPDGRHYFVLEFLDGLNLKQFLEPRGTISLERALPILRAVASALDAAHARGIAHRDLKPENIFIERPDQPEHMLVKLLDFGAATLVESDSDELDEDEEEEWMKTQDGVTLGTPDYMSPEQCQGIEVDQRTDVYSLGMVAYQMLVGALPFGSGHPFEVMARRLQGKPVPPSKASGEVAVALDAPLLKALKENPDERFSSAGEMVAALEETLDQLRADQQAGLAPPPPPPGAGEGQEAEVGAEDEEQAGGADRGEDEDDASSTESGRPKRIRKWLKKLLR